MLLLVLSLAGLVLGAVKLARVPAGASLLVVLSSAIVFLYLAALAGLLEPGAIALLWLGVAIGVVSVFAPAEGSLKAQLAGVVGNMRPRAIASAVAGAGRTLPGSLWHSLFFIVLAVVAVLFVLRLSDNFVFVAWDEFSHWALTSRLMVMDDALHGANSPLYFETYPPGTALIQYLFANTLGYSESAVLFAQVLLTAAAFIAALSGVTRRPLLSLLAFAAIVVIAYALRFKIYEVYVDLVLGAIFGAVLAAIVNADWEKSPPYWIAPVLATLVLTKHMGLVFSAVAIGAIMLLALARIIQDWRASHAFSFRAGLPQIWVGAIALAVVGVIFISWRLYYTSIGAEELYRVPVTVQSVLRFFFDTTDARGIETWEEFGRRMLEKPLISIEVALFETKLELPALHVSLLMIALSAVAVAIAERGRRLQIGVVFFGVAAAAWCYLQLLLFFYRFSFIVYEGVRLASFERYYGSYVLAWAIAIVGAIAVEVARRPLPVRAAAAAVATALILIAPKPLVQTVVQPDEARPVAGVYEWAATYDMQAALRRQLKSLADAVRADGADRDTSIYYISQHETGYTAVMFRYEIVPMRSNRECWSLGARYGTGDVWTCDIGLEEGLATSNYLVIRNADPNFWSRYGSLFPPGDRGIQRGVFAIDHLPSGGFQLRRLPYNDCGDAC